MGVMSIFDLIILFAGEPRGGGVGSLARMFWEECNNCYYSL